MAVGVATADRAGEAEPTRGVLVTEALPEAEPEAAAAAASLGLRAGGAGV